MNRVSGQAEVLVRLRAEARAIAAAGVEAVEAGRRLRPALEAWLAARPGRGGVRVVAAGKAAGAMMRTALDAGVMVERGLVVSTHWAGEWPASITTVRAGHPIPTEASEAAGRAALDLARPPRPTSRCSSCCRAARRRCWRRRPTASRWPTSRRRRSCCSRPARRSTS